MFTALIVLGAGLALIPGLPVIGLLVVVQVLNDAWLPITLIFTYCSSTTRGSQAI